MSSEFFEKTVNYCRTLKRERWIKKLRKRNRNHDFSLITNDCVGGVISHDLGEQFRSPTVNLWIPQDQFLAFAKELRYYLSCEIIEKPDGSKPYPVGQIVPKDDKHIPIEVNFMHYDSFEEGYSKWKQRSARVNYDRLYFIWHFFDNPDTESLREFDRWDVRKLSILHEPIEGVRNCRIVSCYNVDPHNGKILDVVEKTGKRYLDEVDYVSFLSDKR